MFSASQSTIQLHSCVDWALGQHFDCKKGTYSRDSEF